MMRLNLNQLAIFAQVIECEGFSAASQVLFLSQSSVSKQVQNLEIALRTQLVDRSGPKIRPTLAGEVLLAQGREVLALADRTVKAVHAAAQLNREPLVIGSTSTIGGQFLPHVLRELKRREPATQVTLDVTTADRLAEALEEGRTGIGLSGGPLPPGRHRSERLAEDPMVLIGPADHPLAGKELVPADLAGETFLLRECGSQTRRQLTDLLHGWELAGARTLDLWGTEGVKEAVRLGLGIGLVPRSSVRLDVRHGELAELTVHPSPEPRTVTASWTLARPLTASEQLLLPLLREVARAAAATAPA
ncbi:MULTISPECIES: LysR family transcriptional regulator [Kitasatospora]|uniref:DNA-binding transcriptional LysR family regulator n=2 Tax=Kitasatospora TaxID=2063 RepID=A0ABT1J8Z9_9ACTN|nr:LysR family transcriptional regulator [Kitasatospora paracochleata]MCP2313669.1 DNA-binding transcriptional LysR family regulator [Kitasatospora paracochleata]